MEGPPRKPTGADFIARTEGVRQAAV